MIVARCGCGGGKGAECCGNFDLAGCADDFWDPCGLFRCETCSGGLWAVDAAPSQADAGRGAAQRLAPGLCAGKRRAGLPMVGPFAGADAFALRLCPGGRRRGGVCGLQSLSDQKVSLYRPGYREKKR